MIILRNPQEVAEKIAEDFYTLSQKSIAGHGIFNVALAGGNTPLLAYEIMSDTYREKIQWNKVHIFWSDERFVPPDHTDSGIPPVKKALIDKVTIPEKNIHPFITTNCTLEEAAITYSNILQEHFKSNLPRFDLILLGLGLDGHTASLFPHSHTYDSTEIIDVEKNSPKPPPVRLTFTHKLINNAKEIRVIVTGKEKSSILKRVFTEKIDPKNIPAQGIKPDNGTLEFIVDKEAAASL